MDFSNDADFTYAAKVTSIYKKVISELLIDVDNNVKAAIYLREKEKGQVKDNFGIGRSDNI